MRLILSFITIIVVFLVGIAGIDFYFSDNFISGRIHELENFHYASIVILTLILVWVAYSQLSGIYKTSKSDFLFRIESRWGSPEIINARKIIQQLYCEARGEIKSEEYNHSLIIGSIQEKIKEMGKKAEKAEDFVALLNLLDFMETISYFTKNGSVSFKQVQELSGYSLIFLYEIFQKWIQVRREKYGKPGYYCDFEWLVKKIQYNDTKVCWVNKIFCK